MATNTQKINTKSVLKYALLPGIVPRAKELGGSGFGYLAFLFASIFRAVNILPVNHPYANPSNIGKFGIIKVFGAAANHIKFDRKHIDQILVFGALLSGVVLMAIQFVLLLLALFTGQAFAQTGTSAPFTSMFQTPNPETDIAFLMLDYVFGIPSASGTGGASFFGSNALVATAGPTPLQQGIHALFHFYNLAILLVAAVIFLYYVFVVVIETAQTGVPFGRRFSKIYAPLRLIAAVGLLVPLNYGFNSAQYITLYAAKMGSSFATNGWILYNKNVQNPMGVDNQSLVAMPRVPALDELSYFSSVYHACREMYGIWKEREYNSGQYTNGKKNNVCIAPYVIVKGAAVPFISNDCPSAPGQAPSSGGSVSSYDYAQAKQDFGNRDMEVILGEYDPQANVGFAGSVRPYCGKIKISLSNDNPSFYASGTTSNSSNPSSSATPSAGIRYTEYFYYKFVQTILDPDGVVFKNSSGQMQKTSTRFGALGERAAHTGVPVHSPAYDPCWKSDVLCDKTSNSGICGVQSPTNANQNVTPPKIQQCGQKASNWAPPVSTFQGELSANRISSEVKLRQNYEIFRKNLNLQMTPELEKRGWGGAGIWFNNIADMNGAFTGAIYATPTVKAFPLVMEEVKKKRQESDANTEVCDIFEPNIKDNKQVTFDNKSDRPIAMVLNRTYKYFVCQKGAQEDGAEMPSSSGSASPSSPSHDPCNPGSGGTYTPLRNASPTKGVSANAIVDVMSLIFGINGLFDIRENSRSCVDGELKPAVNPLAQLTTVGKSLVENAIRSMATAIFASFGGGMLGVLGSAFGPALDAISGMFVGIATIGLTAGFILYYILPFLPFIYFFFAVASWVKSIFEAMVGVPLWALAHLKIDGEGFSGRSAAGGYFLILEIFLRPIVTLFGLLGGMACFTAMATMLNLLFDLVITNITGATPGASNADLSVSEIESLRRGIIDQFFFTIMYAILLYMMATASFKMIDTIPRNFMRWLNSGVGTFNDNKGDPTSSLTSYASIGGNQISGAVFGGITQASKAAGELTGAAIKTAGGTEAKKG